MRARYLLSSLGLFSTVCSSAHSSIHSNGYSPMLEVANTHWTQDDAKNRKLEGHPRIRRRTPVEQRASPKRHNAPPIEAKASGEAPKNKKSTIASTKSSGDVDPSGPRPALKSPRGSSRDNLSSISKDSKHSVHRDKQKKELVSRPSNQSASQSSSLPSSPGRATEGQERSGTGHVKGQRRLPATLTKQVAEDDHPTWLARAQHTYNVASRRARGQTIRGKLKTLPDMEKFRKMRVNAQKARADGKQPIYLLQEALKRPVSPNTEHIAKQADAAGKTIAVTGAMHARVSREAIAEAQSAHRWKDMANLTRSGAIATVRSRAQLHKNKALQAQYQMQTKATDSPSKASAARQDYEAAVEEYKDVHREYRETRNAFPPGSDSEDAVGKFP